MKKLHPDNYGNNQPADDNALLREKLVEKHFRDLDLDQVHIGVHNAQFDSEKVYSNIINAIDEEVVPVKRTYTRWLVAASLIAVFVLTWLSRYTILNYLSPVHTLEVAAANGNVTSIVLADGTKIWLNGGSKLKYPDTFHGDRREVSIEGEAFFDVTHDADKPFIVRSGEISTQVLGTSFNIKAYADEQTLKVDVVSGKVGVLPSTESSVEFKTIFLTPAEGVVYNKKDHSIQKSTGNEAGVNNWRDGKLIFKHTPLPEVVKTLSRKFNYTITADGNLSTCYITADFTNEQLKDIMSVIAKLIKGKAIPNGTAYHLKGKGCEK